MEAYSAMLAGLRKPETMERFAKLYGRREGELARQLTRYSQLVKDHENMFNSQKSLYAISSPGRMEIIGNHTDHNNGRVIAAAVTLDTISVAAPRDDMKVIIHSEGFPLMEISLEELSVKPEEKATSSALVRGVAARMKELGFKIGGFEAAMTTDVVSGSGLSSSAAYEVMICQILDTLYNDGNMDSTVRAQISQYAENVYFGKPCGLLDQMASSTGGLVAIDFKDEPVVEPLSFSFNEAGYDIVVVDTGSSHDNLTEEYASIRSDMEAVARLCGEKVLRRVRAEQVYMHVGEIRKKLGERAILRAHHYFEENDRVKKMIRNIKEKNIPGMFENMIASGESSWMLLQNVYVPGHNQPLALALAMSRYHLKGKGAWRVHGGGFAGTTLNFVPSDLTESYVEKMKNAFGDRSCFILDVRPVGPDVVFKSLQ